MATLTSSLIVALVDRVSAPARAAAASIKGIAAAAAAANKGGLAAIAERNNKALARLNSRLLAAGASALVAYKGIASPIKAAMDFETAMSNVRKVVDFETPEAFKKMGDDIRAMSKVMPMTAERIADIVQAAGQGGVAQKDLLAFAEGVVKVSTAWDTAAGMTGEALAQMMTAMGLTVPQVMTLADVMNYLSNETAASAPKILDFMQRVGPSGKVAGYAADEVAAYGTAMISAGYDADVAGTTFRRMANALTLGSSATKRQKGAFAELGTNAVAVSKSMQKNAAGTTEAILDLIAAQPKDKQGAFIHDIFGEEARAVSVLVAQRKLTKEALLLAKSQKAAGSAQREYDARLETTKNKLELFNNGVRDLSRSIGFALIPSFSGALDAIGPYVTRVTTWVQANEKIVANMVKLVGGLVAFRVAVIAGSFALTFMKGALIAVARPLLAAAVAMGTFVASMATAAFAGVVARLASLRRALLSIMVLGAVGGPAAAFRAMGVAMLGLLSPIGLVTGALRLLKLAVIGTGIGAILVAIAAAGLFIYENWSGLGEFFTAFGSAFMAALGPLAPAIEPLIGGVKWLWDTVSGFFGEISPATWTAWGTQAGAAVGAVAAAILNLPSKIAGLATDLYNGALNWMGRMLDGAVAGFVHIAEFLASIPRKFFELGGPAGIAMYDAGVAALQGLWDGMKAKMSELMGWLGGIGDGIAGVFSGIPGKIKSAFGFKQATDPGALDGKTPRQRERVYRALGGMVEPVPDVNRETAGHDPRRTGEAVPTGRRPRSESLRVIGVNPEDRDAMPEFAPTLTPTVDKTALVDLDKTVADVAAAMSGLSTTTAKPQVDPAPLMGLLDIINKINAGLSAISSSAGPVAATAGSKLQAGGGVARLGRAALSDYGSETGGI